MYIIARPSLQYDLRTNKGAVDGQTWGIIALLLTLMGTLHNTQCTVHLLIGTLHNTQLVYLLMGHTGRNYVTRPKIHMLLDTHWPLVHTYHKL